MNADHGKKNIEKSANKKLECQRDEFDIPENISYFNVAGISPLLKTSHEKGLNGLKFKLHPWQINNEHFFSQVDRLKQTFGSLIGSPAEHIAICPSATYGIETALKNIPIHPGDEIVIQAEEFPALVLPLKRLAQSKNAKIIVVPRPQNSSWTENYLACLSPQTKIVAFGLSHWTDGSMLDGVAISQAAHKLNATVLVDACQSLGAMPLNVNELQPDFLVAPTYKWLLGPYNCGFLYVSKKYLNGTPLEEYWASRKGADNFANLTAYEDQYLEGAARFDMSERSQFVGIPVAQDALERILYWTPQSISEYLKPICLEIAEYAKKLGYIVPPTDSLSSHFIGIKNTTGFSETEKNSFIEKNIYLSFRGEWMRISPHVFIQRKDIDRLLSHLKTSKA